MSIDISQQIINDVDRNIYRGMLFGSGYNEKVVSVYVDYNYNQIEVGNYSYDKGLLDRKVTYEYGFVRIQLDRNLPRLLLESRSNNGAFNSSSLPFTLNSNNILSLEGDFNKYFTVFEPNGYSRDTLYIFTPNVMQSFVDNLSGYDIEIFNNELYIYSVETFELEDNVKILEIITKMLVCYEALQNQSANYSDDKATDENVGAIASGGNKISRSHRFQVWYVVSIVIIMLIMIVISPEFWLFSVGVMISIGLIIYFLIVNVLNL